MFAPADAPFSTDYWEFPPGIQWNQAVTGNKPDTSHPALIAGWWLGMLIALVVIRILYDRVE